MDGITPEDIERAIKANQFQDLETLYEIVGMDTLLQLITTFQGCYIYIPRVSTLAKKTREERIYADYSSGLSYRQLSQKYNLTTRGISYIISKVRQQKQSDNSG